MIEFIYKRFSVYFEKNDPANGGSAYLRSKIKNAYETLKINLPEINEKKEEESEKKDEIDKK